MKTSEKTDSEDLPMLEDFSYRKFTDGKFINVSITRI